MSQKHFNQGNIWGRVKAFKEGSNISENNNPSLSVHLDCSGKYGNIMILGRIWGQNKIDQFLGYHKDNPDAFWRFTGFISQYYKGMNNYINFSFYKWNVIDFDNPRAAFILKGNVLEKNIRQDGGIVTLEIIKPASGNYKEFAEKFTLLFLDYDLFQSFSEGQIVEMKGFMQQGNGEDEFGSSTGEVHPVVKVARVIKQ